MLYILVKVIYKEYLMCQRFLRYRDVPPCFKHGRSRHPASRDISTSLYVTSV